MKRLLENKKNNWLLYIGVAGMFLALLLSILFQDDEGFRSSREDMFINHSFAFIVIGSLLMAPILEELSFRSFFTNKKWLVITGCVLLPGIIYMTANNYFGWISLVFFYSLFLWNYISPSKRSGIFLIITSSLLFALIHYKWNDFQAFSTYGGIIYKVSLSLLGVWATQNFGLSRSMLLHAVNNSVVVLILILSIQFPDTTQQTYEDKNVKIIWSRVPRFIGSDSNPRMVYNNDDKVGETMVATDSSPLEFGYNMNIKDSIAIPVEPFMSYNFNLMVKDKNIDLLEDQKVLKDFLIKKELIYIMKKE